MTVAFKWFEYNINRQINDIKCRIKLCEEKLEWEMWNFGIFTVAKVIGNKFTWAGELVRQFLRNKILITDPCSIANMCTQYFSQVDAIWEFTRSSCE